jgi:hypothetical protein
VSELDARFDPEQQMMIARQVIELHEAGAQVVMHAEPMGPGVLGYLVQRVPNGTMMVHVDANRPPVEQWLMMQHAFEFIFDGLDAEWGITETVDAQGETVRYRGLNIRVEADGVSTTEAISGGT